MDNSLPQVELLPNQGQIPHSDQPPKAWYKSQRLIIFCIVFLLCSLVTLTYLYSRPALYKSYATLLTVAQTAVDQQSSEADIQHVAIQRQLLTGQALLDKTLNRLNLSQSQNTPDDLAFAANLTASSIRNMLSVQAVPETNLVELAATGYHPRILTTFINTWIDVYLESRAEEIKQTTGLTLGVLKEELSGLEHKILIKRSELEQFRADNDITSLGRENIFENQSLARFKSLNQSLNTTNEEVIKSKAQLDAINKAITEGKMLVPSEDKRGMQVLELRLQELREQLAEFDRKYTRQYLALHPNLNLLPGKIKALEREIYKKQSYGQSIVLTEAEQNYEAAQQSFIEISKQLEEHKQKATEFSSKFTEHESLLNDLEGLELLQRKTQERMVQIEAKQAEKFPQVKIIENAFLPFEPISPDYTRDAIIAIIGSFLFALIVIILFEFLTKKDNSRASVSISSVNMYNDTPPGLMNNLHQTIAPIAQTVSQSLAQNEIHSLESNNLESNSPESNSLKELSVEAINALFEVSDTKAEQLIALLLSGLSLGEVSTVNKESFDFTQNTLSIAGSKQRIIPLNSALKTLFENTEPCPIWKQSKTVSEETLNAILNYVSADAGFNHSQQISAELISNSYILYLVKQGLRLSELEQIVGYIEPTDLSKFTPYSPDQKGLKIADINRVHPSLTANIE